MTINPATRVLISGTKWVCAEQPFGKAQSNSDPEVKNPRYTQAGKKMASIKHGGKDDKSLWSNWSFQRA